MVQLIVKIEKILDSEPDYVLINSDLAKKYDIMPGQLIELAPYDIGLKVYTSDNYSKLHLGISSKVSQEYGIHKGNEISIKEISNENIIHLLHKKMRGESLKNDEISVSYTHLTLPTTPYV